MSEYTISREGAELGAFDLSQIEEGLKSGFFKQDDWGWKEGMPEWQPLARLTTAGAATGPMVGKPKPVAANPVVVTPAVNPYAAPKAAQLQPGAAVGSVPYPVLQELRGTRPWVRLISVLMWIASILNLLGLSFYLIMGLAGAGGLANAGQVGAGVGLAVGVLFVIGISAMLVIYPTLKLSKYASSIGRLSASQSFPDLTLALAEQRRFWKFCGILCAIYLGLIILMIVLVMLFGMAFRPGMS